MKYYLSWVKEYPIYEPAEGGYYYPGENVIYLKEFTSWKKANKAFKQLLKDFVDLAEWYGMQYSVSYYGGVGKGIKYPNAQR